MIRTSKTLAIAMALVLTFAMSSSLFARGYRGGRNSISVGRVNINYGGRTRVNVGGIQIDTRGRTQVNVGSRVNVQSGPRTSVNVGSKSVYQRGANYYRAPYYRYHR